MQIKHNSEPSVSSEMRFFEVNLIAMECGIWEWQVCHDQMPIVCGYGATHEIARSGGYDGLLVLLSLGRAKSEID
jgi:hypothetical protein